MLKVLQRTPTSNDGQSFALKNWIEHPPAAPVRIMVTPALAGMMLEYNSNNRPFSKPFIRQLAEQMREGRFEETFAPVQFSDKGRLIDGQHRLAALIEADVTLPFWVAFGAKNQTFSVIDIGRKRTAGDIFAINGVINNIVVAAATRWIYAYKNLFSTRGHHGGFSAPSLRTPRAVYDYYLTLDAAQMEVSARLAATFKNHRLPNPSVAVAAHYICSEKSARDADAFFQKVATGIGFEDRKDPAYRLRERLIEGVTPGEQVEFMLKAWNAARLNRRLAKLKFDGGKLPRAV